MVAPKYSPPANALRCRCGVFQCSESEASASYVQNALDSAMEVLAPHVPANRPFIAEIQNSVDLLKQHLIC